MVVTLRRNSSTIITIKLDDGTAMSGINMGLKEMEVPDNAVEIQYLEGTRLIDIQPLNEEAEAEPAAEASEPVQQFGDITAPAEMPSDKELEIAAKAAVGLELDMETGNINDDEGNVVASVEDEELAEIEAELKAMEEAEKSDNESAD